MKHARHLLLMATLLLSCLSVSAHDFVMGGIYYKITSSTDLTVAVTCRGDYPNDYSDEYTGTVTIPESVTYNYKTYRVTSIGDAAFQWCSNVTFINIPASVTSIGVNAFTGTSWYSNQPNGMIYVGNVLYGYKGEMPANTSIEVKDGTVAISSYVFYEVRDRLVSITIPESVTLIGNGAFSYCENLASISIPKKSKLAKIGSTAFENCRSLTSIALPGDLIEIGRSAFIDCGSLTSITIPEGVTSIGEKTFYGCSSLTSITIPEGVTSIGEKTFYGCSALTSITIPKSVTSIGDYAFYGCSGLTSVHISSIEDWCGISFEDNYSNPLACGANLYMNGELVTGVDISEGVTSIGNYAFTGYTNLTSITIPESVTSIGEEAFYNCSNLKRVANLSNLNFVKGGTSYGYIAYYANKVVNAPGCAILGDFVFYTVSGEHYLVDYWGTSSRVVLPDNYNGESYNIAASAFRDCSEILSLTVSSKVKEIAYDAFYGCDIAKVFWLNNTPPEGYKNLCGRINYVANNQFDLSNKFVLQFLSSKFEVDGLCIVPTDVAGRKCCVVDYDPLSLQSDVTIEDTVMFQRPQGKVAFQVNDVMPYAFYMSDALETLTLQNLGGIGDSAFEGCTSLETLTFQNFGRIGASAFEGCKALTKVEIPVSISLVGDNAFKGCSSLTSAKFVDRETPLPLGKQLFANSSLTSLYLGAKISYISLASEDNSPFSNSKSLKSVVITNVESDIYDYEFYGCSSLESAEVGDGVERIGRWAFSGCSSLTDFVFGSNVTSIGEEAFSDCVNLINITGRAIYPPVCGSQALDDINKMECTLSVPERDLASYQEAEQWKEFLFIDNLVTEDNYVTYMIDDEVYKTLLLTPGERIVAPYVSDKNGNAFAGWDMERYMNETVTGVAYPIMPDEDIVINGHYATRTYTITYKVNGVVYKTESAVPGSTIRLLPVPTKEGYTFSGWTNAPEVMPNRDITISGSLIVNKYTITYKVNGVNYAEVPVEYGAAIPVIDNPEIEGYTFTGWSNLPEVMPAWDIIVEGSLAVNYYTITYMVDDEKYYTQSVKYGDVVHVIAEPVKEGYIFSGWINVTERMPAKNIVIYGSFTEDMKECITSINQLKNETLYYISLPHHSKGLATWAIAEGGIALKSNVDLFLTPDSTDPKQQFAFISNDGGATHYLYHAAEKKFVGKKGVLTEYPVDSILFKDGYFDNTFFAYFDSDNHINVGGSSEMVVDNWSYADGGNSAVIKPVAVFNPEEALAAFVEKVTGITLNYTKATLIEGKTLTLIATVLPSNATNKVVTWSSSNNNVATISSNGDVKAVNVGTATITAEIGSFKATCTITVERKVVEATGIKLNKSSVSLTEGETLTLTATVLPSNATNKVVTWSSSNSSVATVGSSGKVKAVSAGKATITAKIGSFKATCTVTVEKKVVEVTSVKLNKYTATLSEGETLTLTATVLPSNATDKTVTWSSSNQSVITVDNDGIVKAVGEGTAQVIVKAGAKMSTCTITVIVASGVDGVTVDEEEVVIYDLSGRRVLNPTKGVYIINGKKVVIK